MTWLLRLLRPITHPVIASERDVGRYVARVTAVVLTLALTIDVVNQLTFFTDWSSAFRSWVVTVFAVLVSAVPITMLIARAQRDLYEAKRKVEELSRTDPLTGLPNRRAIMGAVGEDGAAVMVLVIVDIDRFKGINDNHGHYSGDQVICTVGQRLSEHLRDATLVGRLGGEEFAILASADSAVPLIQSLDHLREQLAATPLVVGGAAISVTVSAGAAVRAEHEPFQQLYTEADAALYRAKNAGRNRIVLSPRLERLCPRPAASRDAAA